MENFRTEILRETREIMLNFEQNESSLKSWQGSETKGFELAFSGEKRGIPQNSGIVGQIFISEDGGFEAFITGYLLKNGLRSIVCSFSLTPSSSVRCQLVTGLHPLTIVVGNVVTVTQLLMLSNIRNEILKHLKPKDVVKMAMTSRVARQILTGNDVDKTFWKENLKKEFGVEKVRQTIQSGRTFYGVYCDSKNAEGRRNIQNPRVQNENPLLIRDPRNDPLRVPDHGRMRPFHPDPDSEFFNPLGGFLPPGVPGGNPQVPDFFRGPDHPDLNPLAGGFGLPRGGGSHGRPFMRGPGGNGGGFI